MNTLINKNAQTVKEAREHLGGISESTFYELVKGGYLKTFRVGRRRMVLTSELDAYIERQTEA